VRLEVPTVLNVDQECCPFSIGVIRNVNNVHIGVLSMNGVLTVLSTSLGPAPCVEHYSSLSATYERCHNGEISVDPGLSQGLYPRDMPFGDSSCLSCLKV